MGISHSDYLLIKARLEKNQLKSHETYRPLPYPQPEQALFHEPLAAPQGASPHPGRFLVRVTSRRRKLIDPDNLCPKYFIDCLRYAQIIPDDTPDCIQISIRQEKSETNCTEIEVIPL